MEATEDIKARLDIADLIGDYLTLKPSGSGTFKAVCPFHQERTPSFYVSRSRQTWHCFGCNEGGDHFSFVQKIEGMDFREALQLLAQKAGVILPSFDVEASKNKHRLIEVSELAMRFFRSALVNLPQAEHARAYLLKRGVDELTADLFKLGYAPNQWSMLSEALMNKGVTADELVKAGLSAKRERGDGVYDRFRDRVMFPIADIHGNIVGFTGRILQDDKKEAKYVNTPETTIYRKSAILYGLDRAKGEIRQRDQVVLVEGNMDVIASHQFNIANVVACSGTALTQEQLALLKRFTTNLCIAFDQDSAGKAATLRGLDLARMQEFSIRIITLPPDAGKDPDDAIRKDPAIWKKAIDDAVNIMDWIYRQAFAHHPQSTPEGKKQIARELLPEIKRIPDAIERDGWLKKLAHDLAVSETVLQEALQQTKTAVIPMAAKPQVHSKDEGSGVAPQTSEELREERFMSLLLARPEAFKEAKEKLGWEATEFNDPQLQSLYETLRLSYDAGKFMQAFPGVPSGSTLSPPPTLSSDQVALFN
ncbi:DNA primase, partial [Patescibacteria group bacterium]|nr:DNA primase [Patescibacteria group bacterium]